MSAPAAAFSGRLPGERMVRQPGFQIAASACAGAHLNYFGGPLLQTPIVVPVWWTANVPATVQNNLAQFYADVTQSSYWQMLQEYDSVGLSPGSSQAILGGTATAAVTITPVQCSGTNTCTLTDAQIQTELKAQITAGVLPAPVLDCSGNTRTIYMVHFPSNVNIRDPFNTRSCAAGGFCAYHYTGKYGPNNIPLVYGVMPDQGSGGCATGCGTNGNVLANTTETASHELSEAATDPDIGLLPATATAFVAPGGWYDTKCGEIGDICVDGVSKGDTITVGGRSWVVQQNWSNKQGKCASSGTVQAVCSGTTLTNCRKCSCEDTGVACNGATGVCETSAANVLFGACEQCTATNNTCGAGSSCQQSSTPAQDDLCTAGCTPNTACPAGLNCGTISNGCGGTISCGPACTGPQTCGGGGAANVCGCTPVTTCGAGQNCGTISNGCGGTVNCGPACAGPQTCGGAGTANVCGCTPITACAVGQNCGTISNGCGGTVNCGPACAGPQTCGGAGTANVCGCTPITACAAGQNCGTISNGCGGTVNCGPACTGPQTCGGAGTANVCGCTPITACAAGQNCGTIPNGCGGTVSCGSCSGSQTCGGAGVANACGCTPITTCGAGQNCGTIANGCGGTVTCGACSGTDTCGGAGTSNVCGCTPITSCGAGQNCGTIANGCGGTVTCGACSGTETCGGSGTANVCGCTPLTACAAGQVCGTIGDGCGGTISCGTCASDLTCDQHQCTAAVADAGQPADAGTPPVDAGLDDAGITPDDDAGTSSDAGGVDSGVDDAGQAPADASVPDQDAGTQADGGDGQMKASGCTCQSIDPSSSALLVMALGWFSRRRRSKG